MVYTKKFAALLCILISITNLTIHTYEFIRFHHLKCLSQSHYFLSLLNERDYTYQICNCCKQNHCIKFDTALFFHEKIISCITDMQKKSSLKPMVDLSREINLYSHQKDEIFIREFFLLLFIVHKQILLTAYKEKPHALKTINLETILEISEKINQLPIAEILNAINMLIVELPPFLEKYEFHSSITWKEWLKKYWWVPPIFGGWFALKILLSLQRPHYYFSPYLSSRPTTPFPPMATSDPVLAEIIVDGPLPKVRKTDLSN